MTDISDRFRRVADGFTATIAAAPDDAWSNPSPCEGWSARDVVGHLVGWLPGPGFLMGAFDVDAGPIPSVDDDPAASWAVVRDAIQAGLDDPEVANRLRDCGPPGEMTFQAAVDMTCIPDVLVHTWDLATAVGIPVELDEAEVAAQAAGVDATPPELDAAMRASGQFGPRMDVAADADALTRLLGFYGRSVDGATDR